MKCSRCGNDATKYVGLRPCFEATKKLMNGQWTDAVPMRKTWQCDVCGSPQDGWKRTQENSTEGYGRVYTEIVGPAA